MRGPIHSGIPSSLCQSVDISDNQGAIGRTVRMISSIQVKKRPFPYLELPLLATGTSYGLVDHPVELS
jgi:hypothetical protein